MLLAGKRTRDYFSNGMKQQLFEAVLWTTIVALVSHWIQSSPISSLEWQLLKLKKKSVSNDFNRWLNI